MNLGDLTVTYNLEEQDKFDIAEGCIYKLNRKIVESYTNE